MSFPRYPKYKDSGVDWLGEVPEHWGSARLRWLSTRFSGGTPDRENPLYWECGTIPWLNSGAVNQRSITAPSAFITDAGFQNSSAKWIPQGALVIALAGQGKTKGMVAQLEMAATCNQSMAAILPAAEIDSRFLYWWLTSNYQNIRNLAGGDLRDGLNLELLGDVWCPLPILSEQRSVAAMLDSEVAKLDMLVEEQQRLITALKEKCQAAISHLVTRGQNPAAPLKPSGVQWIDRTPVHWDLLSIKRDLSFVTSGSRGWAAHYADDGELFLRIGNLTREGIGLDLADVQRVNVPDDVEGARTRTCPGDLLFSITAYLGSVAVVPHNIEPAYVSQHIALVRLKGRHLLPEWVAYCAKSYTGQAYFDLRAYGGTKVQLSLDDVAEMPIPAPPLSEQREMITIIRNMTARYALLISQVECSIALLQERRDALISAAVTGKINVRNYAAGQAEAA